MKSKVQSTWEGNGKGYIVYIASLLAVVALIGNVLVLATPQQPQEVPISKVITLPLSTYLGNQKIDNVIEQGQWLIVTTTNGEKMRANIGTLSDNERYILEGFLRWSMSLDIQDVARNRPNIDPTNLKKGQVPLQSLVREIFTDNKTDNMTTALLKNLGVPVLMISPDKDTASPQDGNTNTRVKYEVRPEVNINWGSLLSGFLLGAIPVGAALFFMLSRARRANN
ncbi:MAG: hypothetical protein QGG15_02720 [Dehalococcoidales bacterium]|nr:hypothetical protein [Dehalococcoidales bacterium]MDP6737925.1 hypothetical protein [Dehalococcoidales bacterium]